MDGGGGATPGRVRVRPGNSGVGSSAHSGSAYADGADDADDTTSSSASGSGAGSPQLRGAGSDGQPGTPGSASGASAAAPPAAVPFNPPDSVQQWLQEEDWHTLSRQFAEAEEKALVWTEGDSEESRSQLSSSVSPSTLPRRRRRRQWNQEFNLVGSDSRKPPPLRRYFDSVPAESSPPTQSVRRGTRQAAALASGSVSAGSSPAMHHAGWVDTWHQTASVNNDILHPHLRHYFDRRGIEASYRQRPHIDHESCRQLRPRTPQRPPIRDMLMKYSLSDSSLMSSGSSAAPGPGADKLDVKNRSQGSIHWGKRCLIYGADPTVNRVPKGQRARGEGRIPWINDHHRSEAEDNELMNPMLRHYFDADGIESSFRNRGRHYGRPPRAVFGCSNFKDYQPAASLAASPSGSAGGTARR